MSISEQNLIDYLTGMWISSPPSTITNIRGLDLNDTLLVEEISGPIQKKPIAAGLTESTNRFKMRLAHSSKTAADTLLGYLADYPGNQPAMALEDDFDTFSGWTDRSGSGSASASGSVLTINDKFYSKALSGYTLTLVESIEMKIKAGHASCKVGGYFCNSWNGPGARVRLEGTSLKLWATGYTGTVLATVALGDYVTVKWTNFDWASFESDIYVDGVLNKSSVVSLNNVNSPDAFVIEEDAGYDGYIDYVKAYRRPYVDLNSLQRRPTLSKQYLGQDILGDHVWDIEMEVWGLE